MRVAPPRPRSDIPWHGHFIQADRPLDGCSAYVRGELCDGTLVRVGKGSRPRIKEPVG